MDFKKSKTTNFSYNSNSGKNNNYQCFIINKNGIEKYLGSGLIEGIGPKFAKQIVKEFGENTINIIENNPMKLLDIPKIGIKRVQAIKDSWQKHKNIKDLMIFLSGCGILATVAHKIYKVYGEESITKLKENPYSIVDDIYGLGFKTADMITEKLGLSKETYSRTRAGIFHILRARNVVVLIGDDKDLKYAVQNNISNDRRTLLKKRLLNKFQYK